MTHELIETLLYPFSNHLLSADENARVLFLNGEADQGLSIFPHLQVQQYQKHLVNPLQAQGFTVSADLPAADQHYDIVMILAPKQRVEWHYLFAQGLQYLREGGLILCAAANDAGGKRLQADIEEFGLQALSESKNKARVVWAHRPAELNNDRIQAALKEGALQDVGDSGFISQPGIFGWDKIDRGSALLALTIPLESLKGTGADFGCGYGFLSHYVLKSQPAIKALHAIDMDARALQCCARNVTEYADKVQTHWLDINTDPLPSRLNFIVMNPPFHEGKATVHTLGKRFIERAHESLAPQGTLWMVANNHLPYDVLLQDLFRQSDCILTKDGFKIFKALK